MRSSSQASGDAGELRLPDANAVNPEQLHPQQQRFQSAQACNHLLIIRRAQCLVSLLTYQNHITSDQPDLPPPAQEGLWGALWLGIRLEGCRLLIVLLASQASIWQGRHGSGRAGRGSSCVR